MNRLYQSFLNMLQPPLSRSTGFFIICGLYTVYSTQPTVFDSTLIQVTPRKIISNFTPSEEYRQLYQIYAHADNAEIRFMYTHLRQSGALCMVAYKQEELGVSLKLLPLQKAFESANLPGILGGSSDYDAMLKMYDQTIDRLDPDLQAQLNLYRRWDPGEPTLGFLGPSNTHDPLSELRRIHEEKQEILDTAHRVRVRRERLRREEQRRADGDGVMEYEISGSPTLDASIMGQLGVDSPMGSQLDSQMESSVMDSISTLSQQDLPFLPGLSFTSCPTSDPLFSDSEEV